MYLYLIFCIASEMGLSYEDLSGMWMGFVCICSIIVVLNIVPAVGIVISGWTYRFCRKLFPIHALMLFVLMVDCLFVIFFAWPVKFLFL